MNPTRGLLIAPMTLALLLPALVVLPTASAWPDLEDAVVRPGVKIRLDKPGGSSYCTANFVFKDVDTNKLYLGTAAHCVNADLGANVRLASETEYVERRAGLVSNGPIIGTTAYSSWYYEGSRTQPCFHSAVPLSCSNGVGNSDNDFALIELNSEYAALTHPAMLHFGGPTGVTPVASVGTFDKVLTFGNSPLRPGPEHLDWHEGYVTDVEAPWTVFAYTATPGIPGDSGSGALLGDGTALGIVVTLGLFPFPGQSGISSLETTLDYAIDQTGWNLQLQTWPLLDDGVLPAL